MTNNRPFGTVGGKELIMMLKLPEYGDLRTLVANGTIPQPDAWIISLDAPGGWGWAASTVSTALAGLTEAQVIAACQQLLSPLPDGTPNGKPWRPADFLNPWGPPWTA